MRELERHDAGFAAHCRSLVDALAECRRVDEAVGCIACTTRLANDKLVEFESVLGDLQQRRAGERRTGGGDETSAVEVEALVVELDVVLERPCEHKNNSAT